jgi:hypothetical protein
VLLLLLLLLLRAVLASTVHTASDDVDASASCSFGLL